VTLYWSYDDEFIDFLVVSDVKDPYNRYSALCNAM
jgi:hypothetical protein